MPRSYPVSNSGFIYVLRCVGEDVYKIGITRSIDGKSLPNPIHRIKDIARNCPFLIEVVSLFDTNNLVNTENKILCSVKKYKTRGEWFSCSISEFKELLLDWKQSYFDGKFGKNVWV